LSTSDATPDLLSTPEAGGRVVRGGAIRGAGYAVGTLLGAGTSVFLLRHLGVDDFGRYATVAALLGIVSGISDAGLTAVGARELAVAAPADRPRLLRNLVTLRLVITPIGVLLATMFALVAGYDRVLVLGTLVGGLGVLLVNTQATMMMPLSVELRLGAVTAFEVLKAALTFVAVAILVVAGATLLPFFAAQVAVGAAVVVLTPFVVGRSAGLVPGFDRRIARELVREALPLAAALAMNVVYFRVLVIMTSLLASDHETGIFGTSFRVFEVVFSLPLLVLSTALPLLAVAGRDDDERLRFGLQRMTEVGFAAATALVLAIVVLAPPAIRLLGGPEFEDAAGVLRIQAFALLPVFVGQTVQLGLLAVRRQSALAWSNGSALVVVAALGAILIPVWGAHGAAAAAVVGETCLAVLLYAFLRRARPAVAPRVGLTARVLLASLPAFAALALPLPWPIELVVVLGLFALAATALRAIPHELLHALRTR
jgi:O-antigen/teichoic acid export membrane protein